MNTRFSHSAISLALATSALMLTACGGSSSSSSSEHEHEHSGRVLISDSDSTTLHVFDQAEEAFETLDADAPANGSDLLLADDGLSAAVLGNNSVYFVNAGLEEHEEEHEHEHEEASLISYTVSGSSVGPVIISREHFSILVDGATKFVPTDDMEELSGTDVESFDPVVNQTYPALMLDDDSETVLAFASNAATVYSNGSATTTTISCSDPYLAAESEHITLFGCGTDSLYFISEEGDFDQIAEVTLPNGVTAWPQKWITNGHDIIGYSADALIALETTEEADVVSVTAEDVSDALASASGNFCTAAYATELSEYAAVVTDAGFIYIANIEDNSVLPIHLEDSIGTELSCSDLALAPGAEGFVVADDDADLLYFIDSHNEGGNFHIHEKQDLDSGISGIADMVFMHAIEDGEHDHDH